MDPERLRQLLEAVRKGEIPVDEAIEEIRRLPYVDLEFAKVDVHRSLRCGFPEVIFCAGKRPEHVAEIARAILEGGENLLATRADREIFEAVRSAVPQARYHERARCITVVQKEVSRREGLVLVVSGGTSDEPVAEEARVTAEMMGSRVETLYDVGVAGIHRLLDHTRAIFEADVIIVVAGMEGALASVVGGLTRRPVIAVPTSVGYGASFGGIAPLLSMLNSCAAGVSVVNIDNGFGAGYVASLITDRTHAKGG
jgi:NCAIR mutase (PurE)-related protein